MGDDARSPEHRIRCLPPVPYQGGDERLPFEIDGKRKAVSLKIGGFNRQLVAGLPSDCLDLLEIAALVYAVDAAVSRGGLTDRNMGQAWNRGFDVEMPVRNPDLWNSSDVKNSLEETLQFLSGDRFRFEFVKGDALPVESKWFDFGTDAGWQADRVLMFSGGLDSFAGALEEIIEQRTRVALVSHFSSTKIAKVQRDLSAAIEAKDGAERLRHFPMRIQLTSGTNREGTHRTRSFLFAVLGLITAMAFRQDRVSFHENGVVSLNLPPVGNVLGTRATRTTHPQTLHRFSSFFSQVFQKKLRIDNPFFWRTKTDVLQTIERLGMAEMIDVTSSCADTHNRTKQHPHCGRCSQCIDRRFAVLAANMTRWDSEDAYATDLLEGARTSGVDREIALSYVRNACDFEVLSPEQLQSRFPAILSAVEHLDCTRAVALDRLSDLLRRHGAAVSGAMRSVTEKRSSDDYPADSLPRLYGDWQRVRSQGIVTVPTTPIPNDMPEKVVLLIDRKRMAVTIDGIITLAAGSKTAELLITLADEHLKALGQGLDPFDFPTLSGAVLAFQLGLESDETVRKRMTRARNELAKKFESAGRDGNLGRDLIETSDGHGYRLAPDRVTVRVRKDA